MSAQRGYTEPPRRFGHVEPAPKERPFGSISEELPRGSGLQIDVDATIGQVGLDDTGNLLRSRTVRRRQQCDFEPRTGANPWDAGGLAHAVLIFIQPSHLLQ